MDPGPAGPDPRDQPAPGGPRRRGANQNFVGYTKSGEAPSRPAARLPSARSTRRWRRSVTINGYSWGGHHASPRFKRASDRFGFVSYFLPSTHVCIARLVSVLTTSLGPFLSVSAVAGGDLA